MTDIVTRSDRHHPSVASRRTGYLVGAAVNGLLLYLVYVRPGWRAVPFLTDSTTQVLPLVTASMVAGIAANLLYLAWDGRRLRALGELATSAIGLAALARFWQVFPFDFGDQAAGGADWALVARTVLAVAIAGTAIAVGVQLVSLLRPEPAVAS